MLESGNGSPLEGPIKIRKASPLIPRAPYTESDPKTPIDAMKDMGQRDISRHERAEEAIRTHFRERFLQIRDTFMINKKA